MNAPAHDFDEEAAWKGALARDRRLDGAFVIGVLTTGIYCRPSCPARHPKRENIRFFADGAAARAVGLRRHRAHRLAHTRRTGTD